MSLYTTSANMSLLLPTVGEQLSPTWATQLNSSLSIIDQHDHSSGNGVPITPAGMSITSDLPFGNKNATNLRSVRLALQPAVLSLGSDLLCLYAVGVDLYFNDGSGNNVRLTASGGVNGTPGSIGSLASPASATYVSGTPAFVFQSNVNTPANLDGASLTIREVVASGPGITLTAYPGLSSSYSIILPSAPPAGQSFLTMGSDGSFTTIGNVTGGIGTSNLADNAVTTVKITAGAVTSAKLDTNIAVTGTLSSGGTLQQNAKNVLVSNTNASASLAIIRGSVTSGGSITTGEGFTVSHPGTGSYTITFSTAFAAAPVVLVTQGNPTGFAQPASPTTTTVDINTYNAATSLTNSPFTFIAIGVRA